MQCSGARPPRWAFHPLTPADSSSRPVRKLLVQLRATQSLENSRTSMVHLCYVIRDAIELLDFEDENIRDTKRLLLLASMHPSFLKKAEGRRFIAGLFRLDPQLTRELAAIVRNQVGRRGVCALVVAGSSVADLTPCAGPRRCSEAVSVRDDYGAVLVWIGHEACPGGPGHASQDWMELSARRALAPHARTYKPSWILLF